MVRDKDTIIKDIMNKSKELEQINTRLEDVREEIHELSLEELTLNNKKESTVCYLNSLLEELVRE